MYASGAGGLISVKRRKYVLKCSHFYLNELRTKLYGRKKHEKSKDKHKLTNWKSLTGTESIALVSFKHELTFPCIGSKIRFTGLRWNYFENGHFKFGKSKYYVLKCPHILIYAGMCSDLGNEQIFNTSHFKWFKRPSERFWRVIWQLIKIMWFSIKGL